MSTFQEYIKKLREAGKLAFTIDDVEAELGISRNAVVCRIYKLKKKGEIVSPARNLYVIVPPEHQHAGCIPVEELVSIVMGFWQIPYYVSLLSAAMYHGASHQKPQVYQVIVSKQLKPIICGKIKIEFVYKKIIKNLPLLSVPVKSGYLNIASPELTAMDLFFYPNHVGGLNHIATLLGELIEVIDSKKLISLVSLFKSKFWVQRMGYLLEHIDSMDEARQQDVINSLSQYIHGKYLTSIPLAPEIPSKGMPLNHRWMVVENTQVEGDI